MRNPNAAARREIARLDQLSDLYARIPPVSGCRTGCSDCCGPVPMSQEEARRVPSIMRPESYGEARITPIKPDCVTCAYSTPAGCSIYSTRPLMCRLFGAVDDPRMTCPHGARAEKPLTALAARQLVAEYQREMVA